MDEINSLLGKPQTIYFCLVAFEKFWKMPGHVILKANHSDKPANKAARLTHSHFLALFVFDLNALTMMMML